MDILKGFIWNIQRYNVHDGEGIRTIVFFKGCPLRCKWCSNPEGETGVPELKVNKGRCISCGSCIHTCPNKALSLHDSFVYVDRGTCQVCGKCVQICYSGALEVLGKWVTAEEILDELNKDWVFYRRSGGGLTLSGGEVLLQSDFAAHLLKIVKSEGINTAIETCGAVPWKEFKKVLPYVDTFLFDLKHMDEHEHKKYTGVSNTLILENGFKLAKWGGGIVFRMPVVPGINDSKENIKKTAEFANLCNAKYLELLPYHQMGIPKYEMLGKDYTLQKIASPSVEMMAQYKVWANECFEHVIIGK